ncbi:hypothetical protein NPX13_g5829 [Xylaria arbuscula]|uniref:Uncharacterized protein n=1 Tax=Xylaria arbuscula TaxID=114810 RepID=A0A9W8NCZ6_9PEZI|nr:hypothetical protein NPX13_g5829 [Xylaria arbuscula]
MPAQLHFADEHEEEQCSYVSAQKTFLMDGIEVIDASILKTILERMWGPEGRGYFVGFSKKEKTYFILALPEFEVNIKEIRDRVEDAQATLLTLAKSAR